MENYLVSCMDLLHAYYDLVTIHALVNKIRNVIGYSRAPCREGVEVRSGALKYEKKEMGEFKYRYLPWPYTNCRTFVL